MICPTFKPLKKNGTTMYTFPGVAEDKNFETQNDNYKMYLSHFVLVNFPKQVDTKTFDFDLSFSQNGNSATTGFKDQIVESLRNYVANHESVIRNSKINATEFYYDTFEAATTTEKIFWKWAKSLNLIDLEPADTTLDYLGADSKYNVNNAAIDYFREYLWTERKNNIYIVSTDPLVVTKIFLGAPLNYKWDDNGVVKTFPGDALPAATAGYQYATVVLNSTTSIKPGDYLTINKSGLDLLALPTSKVKCVAIGTQISLNDTIVIEIDTTAIVGDFSPIIDLEFTIVYDRFIQFISEISGLNNVQLPDKAYTETFAYTSHQHGQTPYSLFNIKNDNNYKPNLQFPILASEVQLEIQGGENINNPILTNSSLYPGSIYAQFDTGSYYTTKSGNVNKRSGLYYGVTAVNNTDTDLKWPTYNGDTVDGLSLNLNINDYNKAVSYIFPIETFSEFSATAFNNTAPSDFEFNAILWYYTIEDVTGNNVRSATNLYGVEFLDTPENDINVPQQKIPSIKKLVSNGYQDGNAYTFTLDTNILIDSNTDAPSFDPDKVYSLFGMELYYEAMTRMTYLNDQISSIINSNSTLASQVNSLTNLVYTQTSIETIRNRMDNIENLLNVYSTLQIGESDAITPYLDTTVNPPLLRLISTDQQYGNIQHFNTLNMFSTFTNVNGFSQVTKIEKTINVLNKKDFLVVINNNDDDAPTPIYDVNIIQDKLKIVIDKDLYYKQKLDIIITHKSNILSNPFNDKKVEIYINYSKDNNTNTIPYLLGTYSLPVTKTDSTHDELSTKLNNTIFNTQSTYYSKLNTNDRIFSFYVNDDLSFLNQNVSLVSSRVMINNFILSNNPLSTDTPNNINQIADTLFDLSNQLPIYSIESIPSNVINTNIIDTGSGYTTVASPNNYTINLNTGTVINTTFVTLADIITYNNTIIDNPTITFNYVAVSGAITKINIISTTGNILPDTTPIAIPGGTGGTFNFVVNPVSKITFKFNKLQDLAISELIDKYDLLFLGSIIDNGPEFNIDKHMLVKPTISFLNQYKINITRTSNDIIDSAYFNQRYNINTTII